MDPNNKQSKRSDDTLAKISRLANAGLLDRKNLPTLKMAVKKLKQLGDISRLPKNQRDALVSYNDSLVNAALGSQASFGVVRRNLMQHYEITDKEQIVESINEDFMPPQMLVLKRTGIRVFPDGRRVALYNNDKLGLVFTIPYKSNVGLDQLNMVQAEGFDFDNQEEIMESLDQVSKYAQEESPKSSARHMKFADGSKLKVSHGAAKAIHMVHGALNDENKKKFAEMLKEPKGFEKAANFALSKVNFTIKK